MSRLVHDRPLRRARNGRARGVSGSERMPGVLRGIEARPDCQFLDYPRHVNRRRPVRLNLPVPIDRPEQRPAADRRGFDPRLNSADRAGFRVRSVRDADLPTRALLIALGPAQHDRQSVLAEGAILDIKRDQFRPAERPGEPEQNERPVARADRARVRGVYHGADIVSERGGLLLGRGALRAPDALQGVRDDRAMRGRAHARGFVCFRDRVPPPLNAPHLQPSGAFGYVCRDGLSSRGQGAHSVPLAPCAELPPVAFIAPECVLCLRRADVFARLFERGGRNHVRPRARDWAD